MVEKQKKIQGEALEAHKKQVEEEEAKKAEQASLMESNREAKINIEELKNDEEIDVDDI